MYFIVHLQNNKSTKKSVTDIFFFVLEGVYANFISQLHQTVPQTNGGMGGGAREEWEGIQSNFYKACLSAGTLEHVAAEKPKGDIEKYDILSGLHGCRDPSGEASFREREPARFGFSDSDLSTSKHTLCFIFSVVLPSQQESATVVNASPKSIHFDEKKLAHSRRHELFFFF